VTLLGIAGLVGLILWRGAVRYAAEAPGDGEDDGDGADGRDDDAPNGDAAGSDDEPPERKEPEPALP
jgi:hypothetical protein